MQSFSSVSSLTMISNCTLLVMVSNCAVVIFKPILLRWDERACRILVICCFLLLFCLSSNVSNGFPVYNIHKSVVFQLFPCFINTYRTLRGRDKRKNCTLNFIKYTLSRPTVLHDHKECIIALQRVLY